MKHPIQLPIITFHGIRWFVDVRLEELRQADTGDYTPLAFEEFEQQASEDEWEDLIEAIITYLQLRSEAERNAFNHFLENQTI